jgi:hypothetical protein
MLCEMCTSIGRMRASEARQRAPAPMTEDLNLVCVACGKTLGASVGGRVAKTLARLARFGLVGQSRLFRRAT